MPIYDEKLICPFAVRFSQARIRPTFQDGYPVQHSLEEIGFTAAIDTPAAHLYDVLLDAPFPSIEIIRWKPKLREEDGTPLEDARGANVFGEACWFTLDNRRLYCLQCAAMRCWPRRVATPVRVLFASSLKSSVMKFQTTTAGRCVIISRRHDPALGTWDWVEATRSIGGDGVSVTRGLMSVKADSDRVSHEWLCRAPEPGPVRVGVLARQQGSPVKPKVTVARLFELAGAKSNDDDRDANLSSASAKGQELLSILQRDDRKSDFTRPNGCIDWSLLLAGVEAPTVGGVAIDSASDPHEHWTNEAASAWTEWHEATWRDDHVATAAEASWDEGYRDSEESAWAQTRWVEEERNHDGAEWAAGDWVEDKHDNSPDHWDESIWPIDEEDIAQAMGRDLLQEICGHNEVREAEPDEDSWIANEWIVGNDDDFWGDEAAWPQEDEAWDEDGWDDHAQAAAWHDTAWVENEEARWVLQIIKGKWIGMKGEVYIVQENSWSVTRTDRRGRRVFTLTWDEHQKVIRWGTQFYLSDFEEGGGCITWAHHRNPQRTWLWRRQNYPMR